MRILNVTQTYAPFLEFGGPPVKVRALSEALVKLGHEVTVLTVDWGFEGRMAAHIAASKAERSPFGWRAEENGVRSVYLPIWLKYRALSWNPALKRYLRARLQNFDVAHIFGIYDFLGPAVAAMCRSRGIPYVVEPIGMFVPIVRNVLMKRCYHLAFGDAMFRGAGRFVATSTQEVSELVAAGLPGEKIVLRHNGVDAPRVLPEQGTFRRTYGIPMEAKVVLFLGRLSRKKSPDLLLEAFAKLPGALRSNTYLVFVGPDDDMQANLERLAAASGAKERILFCGPLFGSKKWSAYRDADVFVLPSQNENFGNTAAEAVIAGTPVIVTERCGIAPMLAGVAGIVAPHDSNWLTKAINDVLTMPSLRERLREGGKQVAAHLGWEAPAGAMVGLYNQLVAGERRVA